MKTTRQKQIEAIERIQTEVILIESKPEDMRNDRRLQFLKDQIRYIQRKMK